MIPILILFGVVVILGLWLIAIYNGIKRKQIGADQSWSDIDVQLKRRYNLIPNLVETVKGYATHERETLEGVTKARQQAIDVSGVRDQAQAENMLTGALRQLFALSESYPDLKANTNFIHLQEELTGTENKIGIIPHAPPSPTCRRRHRIGHLTPLRLSSGNPAQMVP